jgi:hypothetical protein
MAATCTYGGSALSRLTMAGSLSLSHAVFAGQ